MKTSLLAPFALALALAPALARAQDPQRPAGPPAVAPVEDAFLERFVGVWEGEGRIDGQDALEFSSWDWALGHQFLSVTYMATRLTPELESSTYEGYGYFRPAGDGTYRATWLDSLGVMAPMTARREGEDTLVVDWDPSAAGRGPSRVVYELAAPDRIETTYLRKKGEAFEEIGKVTLTRAKD